MNGLMLKLKISKKYIQKETKNNPKYSDIREL